MRVLVDMSIWSLALRKKEKTEQEQKIVSYLVELIRDLDVIMIGPVRQEILSGIHEKNRFIELRTKIAIFEDFKIETIDYELAAQFYNECRKNGIQGSHIDYLICAIASNNDMSILTMDKDFYNYQKYIGIRIDKSF